MSTNVAITGRITSTPDVVLAGAGRKEPKWSPTPTTTTRSTPTPSV